MLRTQQDKDIHGNKLGPSSHVKPRTPQTVGRFRRSRGNSFPLPEHFCLFQRREKVICSAIIGLKFKTSTRNVMI
jgi:hypothetical protein